MTVSDAQNRHAQNKKTDTLLPVVITTGEPAGIGMDILLQLAVSKKLSQLNRAVIVLADEKALQSRYVQIYGDMNSKIPLWRKIEAETLQNTDDVIKKFGHNLQPINPDQHTAFLLIDTPCSNPVIAGSLDSNNAQMVMTQLELAHILALNKDVSAIVTGPLQKSVLIEAGLTLTDGAMFTGHTEFFMQKSGCDKVVMMLANPAMKVALVTTHLPLRDVADAITKDNLRKTVQIVLDDLKQKFGLPQPKVLVCGLNPHAGEDGHLGMEEIEIINPVLKEFQDSGVTISLAMPADTLFTKRHLQHCDAVIAMYHDQGLPVLKSHGFGNTVNLTLGLPYIRTSVDHGTALDLAGSGQANSSSLWQALKMADEMALEA